jgi:hypothetical protein
MPSPSIIDTRRHQMFPTLALAEIERLRRRSYGRGEPLVSVGEVGQGLTVHLSGEVEVTINLDAARPMSPMAKAHSWASWPNCRAGRPWSTRMRWGRWRRSLSRPNVFGPCSSRRGKSESASCELSFCAAWGGPVIVGPAESGDVIRLQ